MRVQVKKFLVKIHKDAYDFLVTKKTIQKIQFWFLPKMDNNLLYKD